jgi:hypothetical protein
MNLNNLISNNKTLYNWLKILKLNQIKKIMCFNLLFPESMNVETTFFDFLSKKNS